MKKIYILSIAVASIFDAVAQSAPGAPPTSFNSCSASCGRSSGFDCGGATLSFNDKQYTGNNGSNGQDNVGAIWRFYNVATDRDTKTQVNATITIEQAYRAQVIDFDNDNAMDENGNYTLANLFAPTISADQTLDASDRSGYVQFKVSFFQNTVTGSNNKWNSQNYSTPILLSNLNYVHYDIDGVDDDGSGYQLRETGVVNMSPFPNGTIKANATTELNAYSYTADGGTWKGYMGSTCNREHTSQCAQVVAVFQLVKPTSSVTFRMGYNYKGSSRSGLDDQDTQERLYASTFGCFSFPQSIVLPVKLLNFNGSYQDNTATLIWHTESEQHLDHFELEKSTNGSDFAYAGKIAVQSGNTRKEYTFTDNPNVSANDNSLYYRLKMIDADGNYQYSHVVIITRDANANGISFSPNPVTAANGATVRISSATGGKADIRIIDLSGKLVLRQLSYVSRGVNSISINNLDLLKTGMYALQVLQSEESRTLKISLIR
jgi:hypothetical protein